MEHSVEEQIEENVRFCEELLKRNPNFIPEESGIDWVDESPFVSPPEPEQTQQEPSVSTHPVVAVAIPDQPEEHTSKSVVKIVRSLFICVAIALVTGVLITKFVANHTTVEGPSMQPTLQNGDNLVVEKVSYLVGQPDRFDIIVFEHSKRTNYIKRVIGLPGERVRIEGEKIYINDKPIYDPYSDGSLSDGGIASQTITLGSDEYFVLGDNRDSSEDSRSKNVGPVKAGKIKGRAWLRVTPLDQLGFLDS